VPDLCGLLTNTDDIINSLLDEQEKERSDIAHELHSNIAQILVSALLYMGLSRPALSGPTPFFEETEMIINDAINATRKLSSTLFTPHFGEESLVYALDSLVVPPAAQVVIHRNMNGFNELYITHRVKLNIYRIVQAQLRDIARRPGARNVQLSITGDHDGLMLRISDDGIVAPLPADTGTEVPANIMARVSLLKGEVRLTSTPATGTELEVSLGRC
jgi:signal transduction histidine kinase